MANPISPAPLTDEQKMVAAKEKPSSTSGQTDPNSGMQSAASAAGVTPVQSDKVTGYQQSMSGHEAQVAANRDAIGKVVGPIWNSFVGAAAPTFAAPKIAPSTPSLVTSSPATQPVASTLPTPVVGNPNNLAVASRSADTPEQSSINAMDALKNYNNSLKPGETPLKADLKTSQIAGAATAKDALGNSAKVNSDGSYSVSQYDNKGNYIGYATHGLPPTAPATGADPNIVENKNGTTTNTATGETMTNTSSAPITSTMQQLLSTPTNSVAEAKEQSQQILAERARLDATNPVAQAMEKFNAGSAQRNEDFRNGVSQNPDETRRWAQYNAKQALERAKAPQTNGDPLRDSQIAMDRANAAKDMAIANGATEQQIKDNPSLVNRYLPNSVSSDFDTNRLAMQALGGSSFEDLVNNAVAMNKGGSRTSETENQRALKQIAEQEGIKYKGDIDQMKADNATLKSEASVNRQGNLDRNYNKSLAQTAISDLRKQYDEEKKAELVPGAYQKSAAAKALQKRIDSAMKSLATGNPLGKEVYEADEDKETPPAPGSTTQAPPANRPPLTAFNNKK
jgi:hypothetical protein